MSGLVLSVFPGIGMLDMAFEEAGFCVVRGPDVLWGGDVRRFHPPAGVFDGVIGGPPCQSFSAMRQYHNGVGSFGNLIPEYERVVAEASPDWFVMENVRDAPLPDVPSYTVHAQLFNNRWLDEEQSRIRRISFGTRTGARLELPCAALLTRPSAPTVTGGHSAVMSNTRGNMTIAEMCRLQGLPEDFLDSSPFTAHGKRKAIGNGVPLPMGRAIAAAVIEAMR